jgi:hypothetical protein
LANILLGNLAGITPVPPSMAEIAHLVGGVSAEYIREVGQLNGFRAVFGAIVFGFCHTTHQLRAFEIKARRDYSPLTCDIIEHPLNEKNPIVVIGSCPELLRQRIEESRNDDLKPGEVHPIVEMDRPTRALQALIEEQADSSVGGMIQQGWATSIGFQLVAKAQPITPRPPSPRNFGLFVLGFDIADIQHVGSNIVSLVGR